MRAAGVVFFAFIGFDAVSTAAQEARKPQRDMPIGIIGSLAVCTILYVLFAHVLTGMVNYKIFKGDASPVATVIKQFPSEALQITIVIGIIAGYSSVILVMLLGAIARVFLDVARWAAAQGVLRRSPEVPHAVALQPDLHGLCFAVFGLPADFEAGAHDQHRHAAGIRDRVHRHHGDAAYAPGFAASLSHAVGAAWCRFSEFWSVWR